MLIVKDLDVSTTDVDSRNISWEFKSGPDLLSDYEVAVYRSESPGGDDLTGFDLIASGIAADSFGYTDTTLTNLYDPNRLWYYKLGIYKGTGSSLYFDGVNDSVNVGSDTYQNLPITVSAWAKGSNSTAGNFPNNPLAYLYSRYGIYLTRTQFTAYNGSEWHSAICEEPPTDGYWHHYVGLIKLDGTMIFYIDGEEKASTSYIAALDPRHEGEPGMIGAYMPEDNDPVPVAEPSHFKGNIKEVAILNVASTSLIQQLYNNGEIWDINESVSTIKNYLEHYWRINAAEGNNIVDEGMTTNGYGASDGTRNGATWATANGLAGWELAGDGPTKAGYMRDESDDKAYQAILRRKSLGLDKYSGRPLKILKRRTFGTHCSLCWDDVLMRIRWDDCLECHGTGWTNGYFSPLSVVGMMNPSPKYNQITMYGEWRPSDSLLTILNYPPLKIKDVIVDESNKRWAVRSVRTVEKKGFIIEQNAQCSLIAQEDKVYSV